MNLHFGCLGNGLTVYDVDGERNNDYVTVAHIDPCGAYKLYEELPKEFERKIIDMAQKEFAKFKKWWFEASAWCRIDELDRALKWKQFNEIGFTTLYNMSAEKSLAVYIEYCCKNNGYYGKHLVAY